MVRALLWERWEGREEGHAGGRLGCTANQQLIEDVVGFVEVEDEIELAGVACHRVDIHPRIKIRILQSWIL